MRRRRRLRGARAAPPRRAAQGDEPAHQHDGGDAARSWPTRRTARSTSRRERWEDFKKDVAHFRGKHDVKRWEEAQTDHGYNGTPVWNILGTMLANTGPASDGQIDWLTWIDPLFIVGITLHGVVGVRLADDVRRAGGVRDQLPVAVLLDGRRVPALGLAVLFRGRDLPGQEGHGRCWAASSSGYSTLLRIFPLFVFTGPVLVALRQLWGTHAPDDPHWLVRVPDLGWKVVTAKSGKERTVPELVWNQIRIYKPQPFTTLRAFIARIDRRYLRLFVGAALAVADADAAQPGRPAAASAATRRSSSTPRSTRRRRSPTTWGCAR